ncbi:MAG: type II toxin-antitoxin system VapC family toxin [Methylovulum sp.]|nr:MAG: type II toxin-antitoxin system VapC family toxin [Methylovulum sp.]
MKALDTNVLVRFLVKDDAEQAQQVYSLFKQAEIHQQRLFVPLLVVLETIWVLQAVYGIDDQDILTVLNDLLLMPILLFESQPVLHAFIGPATGNNYDLADLLIAHSASGLHCESVLTFDKKAAKFDGFELIGYPHKPGQNLPGF